MNYSDLMDEIAKKPRNTVKLGFNIPGEPGQVCESKIVCRIVSKDIDGTTIEVISFNGSTGEAAGIKPTPQVIPSPS